MIELLLLVNACLLAAILLLLVRCCRALVQADGFGRKACDDLASEMPDQIILEPGDADRLFAPVSALHEAASSVSLTSRERDVLKFVYRGWKAKAIGGELCLSEATVKTHMSNIYRKFGVHSQQEVILLIDALVAKARGWPALCDS